MVRIVAIVEGHGELEAVPILVRGIAPTATAPPDPEAIADAKAWLSARMPDNQSYRETLDQPALSAVFDLAAARTRSPSFDKLYRDVASLVLQSNT